MFKYAFDENDLIQDFKNKLESKPQKNDNNDLMETLKRASYLCEELDKQGAYKEAELLTVMIEKISKVLSGEKVEIKTAEEHMFDAISKDLDNQFSRSPSALKTNKTNKYLANLKETGTLFGRDEFKSDDISYQDDPGLIVEENYDPELLEKDIL